MFETLRYEMNFKNIGIFFGDVSKKTNKKFKSCQTDKLLFQPKDAPLSLSPSLPLSSYLFLSLSLSLSFSLRLYCIGSKCDCTSKSYIFS